MGFAQTIFQHPVATGFIYPFFLIFLIVFAILEKVQVLGENKQLNAMIAAVIGFIFIAAVKPKLIVGDLILFLTIGMVVIFVALMIWGFATGEASFGGGKALKYVIGGIGLVAVFFAVLVASGVDMGIFGRVFDSIFEFLFFSSWSSGLWTNFVFIVMIALVIYAVVKGAGVKKE